MKERPILFSPAMIRALLAGTKTQTRRILKHQPPSDVGRIIGPLMYHPTVIDRNGDEHPGPEVFGVYSDDGGWGTKVDFVPGQRLWVREAWRVASKWDDYPPKNIDPDEDLVELFYEAEYENSPCDGRYRPGMFMPRWASRITLLVESVRVERLQDISEADARAEGITVFPLQSADDPSAWWQSGPGENQARSPSESYAKLWTSINGPGSWKANPLVVAIGFKVERAS